jgi:hypothetical protein
MCIIHGLRGGQTAAAMLKGRDAGGKRPETRSADAATGSGPKKTVFTQNEEYGAAAAAPDYGHRI